MCELSNTELALWGSRMLQELYALRESSRWKWTLHGLADPLTDAAISPRRSEPRMVKHPVH